VTGRAGARALASLLVLGVAGAAAAQPADRRRPPAPPAPAVSERSRVEVAPSGQAIRAVVIENAHGDVRVEGHDGPGLSISAVKRAPDEATLDRLRVSLIPAGDGTMRLLTSIDAGPEDPPLRRGSARIDLVVRAPRSARIDARIDRGTLVLTNMDAGGELDAGTGAIEVRNVSGPVIARALEAPLRFTEVFGAIDASALVGLVALDHIRADRLAATLHRGPIEARRVQVRALELTTTDGDIRIEGEALPGARLRVRSVSGSIDVRLAASGGLRVRAHGKGVDLPGATVSAGAHEVAWAGAAPATLEVRTRHGSVRVVQLLAAAP
jgi:hypothetical protein